MKPTGSKEGYQRECEGKEENGIGKGRKRYTMVERSATLNCGIVENKICAQ